MRRTPIVLAGTMVGLAGVLGFHTSPAQLTLGSVPPTSTTIRSTTTTPSTTSPSSAGPSTSTTTATTSANTSPTTTRPPSATTTVHQSTTTVAPTTTVPTTARTVTGPQVNYYFGTLSVSVTATGKKITKVTIATLDDGGNYRSQSIDQQSIPMLEQQALQAQSAQIQGVSGASYTSAGFAQSLQGALKQLGI
jgi:uncharacterized protein with FMN-binding domain